ncbi:phosphatase RsbU N-terminal domain-containing protein [Nocardioides gansuensis]|uniref:phosphatase RsbU N-terminal domain-containing protein n=1 Tax=Nocardioides gansuensis TaxID=2138300 RepID=UPI001057661D|nr:phosphatase RsbU N-terminal domain-containing protein [Nocardioides gansuensis]
MHDAVSRLRLDYAPVMLRHLSQQDESGLQSAYELGRGAMRDSVGLLEVVRVHNEVFLEVHASSRDLEEARRTARAAAALLLELVAAFEMTQRGFMEGRPAPE